MIHYRIFQMRKAAKKGGKTVPPQEVLEDMARVVVANAMRCPACGRAMNWLFKDGRSTVLTLQHDRSGEWKLICKGCNSRHHLLPGDMFYGLPGGHKRCPKCEKIKPHSEFCTIKTTGEFASGCRDCLKVASLADYYKHKEKRQARRREYLAKKREEKRASD